MPPKAKGKAAADPKAKAAAPAPAGPAAYSGTPLTLEEADKYLSDLQEEDWAEFADLEEPPENLLNVAKAMLLFLGEAESGCNWSVAKAALTQPEELVKELRDLGPFGPLDSQIAKVSDTLAKAELTTLRGGGAPASQAAAPAKAGAKAKAKPAAKAPAKAAPAKAGAPAPAGASKGATAAFALGVYTDAVVAARKNEKPPNFPAMTPVITFKEVHKKLREALHSKQTSVVCCQGPNSYWALAAFWERCGALPIDLSAMLARVSLKKEITMEDVRQDLQISLKNAMENGQKIVFLMGDSPKDLNKICDPKLVPCDVFNGEKLQEVASVIGISAIQPDFQVIIVCMMSKVQAEEELPKRIPAFEEMAVMILEPKSVPKLEDLKAGDGAEPTMRSALWLLATAPPDPPISEEPGPLVTWNTEEFEFKEEFDEDWEKRWFKGPATVDCAGKPIKETLISGLIVKYPANPQVSKQCFQIMGGIKDSHCTGFYTTFDPPIRPTEVEFEFTMNGKVDMVNACILFTEKPFEGILPDTKVGLHFAVRGGMQLSGGGGNLVKISNDGKIKNDQWNKCIIKLDWDKKVTVGQVDTSGKGKGYLAAIQTVPFRDEDCKAFGYCYIYNTDMQACSWFSWIRIKQEANFVMDTKALDARAGIARMLKQREYDKAVAADMEVGMKMGAIKSTKEHGMNLAEEQRANGGGCV
eukprot:gnl/MRDRNA2_/MRDRNA2_27607_c0_seq1.p1 gnl/MRDRNA2_/MRDRNA2_27607_c0~~gnl/MRDRNA2_/MRDRNA2_27607_c0_seq1.p1  ORF type:complete len:698 (+),score=176.80 gnl/MRDRNA2_/MRDRNA2_27607_c0_seq1:99-2192(+)